MESLSPRHGHHAFSLVELLVVLVIMSIMAAVSLPMANSLLEGTQITQGGQLLVDQINLARQLASASNRLIEVRLIESPYGASEGYAYIQLWKVESPDGSGAAPVYTAASRLVSLPASSRVAEDSSAISILEASAAGLQTMPAIGPVGGAAYVAFQVSSNGRIRPMMEMRNFTLTVVSKSSARSSTGADNFAIVQVNPLTAAPRVYRP